MGMKFDSVLGEMREEDTATTAAQIPLVDAGGYYNGTTVEAALQELGSVLSGIKAALEEI